MPLTERVIDSVQVRFLKKGQSRACSSLPAKIVVTDTGTIEIYSSENKFPTVYLKAANVKKPRRPLSKSSTWIYLDIIQNREAKFTFVDIQVNTSSKVEDLYNTLIIAWSPKKSDLFNNDDSFSASDPVHVPPPIKKQTSAGGGRSARANITVEPEGSSLFGFNTDYAKPSSTQNRKQATSDALKSMFDDYGIGNGKDKSRSSNGLPPYNQRETIVLDDADEPPVKRRAEEETASSSSEVAKIQLQLEQSEQKLLQSDHNLRHMCKMDLKNQGVIEELRARVKHLENLIDSKEGIVKNENKASVDDELKKKIAELTGQLEEEKKKSAGMQEKLAHFAELEKEVKVLECDLKEANKQTAEQRSKVNDLTGELDESQLRAAQQRAEDSAKVVEVTAQLEVERQRSVGVQEKLVHYHELEKKVKVLEFGLIEASKQTADQKQRLASDLKQERKRSAELKQKLVQVGDKFAAVSTYFEQQQRSIADTLASVDVQKPSALRHPHIPSRSSMAASTQQKGSEKQPEKAAAGAASKNAQSDEFPPHDSSSPFFLFF